MATNRLFNSLTFTNVAAGASVVLPHLLTNNGKALVPDYGWINNPNFSATADDTNVTVTNNGSTAQSCNVWINAIHTLIRVYGGTSIPDLSPKPFWLIGEGFGGSGASGLTIQRYTATGAEGTDFMVTLTTPRATDDYSVNPALNGMNSAIVGVDCPDLAGADRTTTQFRVVLTAALTAGDIIDFWLADL